MQGSWTILGRTAVFNPEPPVPAGTYNVTVRGGAGGVSDLDGNHLPSDYSFAFALGPPTSSGTIPQFPVQLGFALLVTVVIVASYVVARRITPPRIGSKRGPSGA